MSQVRWPRSSGHIPLRMLTTHAAGRASAAVIAVQGSLPPSKWPTRCARGEATKAVEQVMFNGCGQGSVEGETHALLVTTTKPQWPSGSYPPPAKSAILAFGKGFWLRKLGGGLCSARRYFTVNAGPIAHIQHANCTGIGALVMMMP
jgi:hypothetical protein